MKFTITLALTASHAVQAVKFFDFDSFFDNAFAELENEVFKMEKEQEKQAIKTSIESDKAVSVAQNEPEIDEQEWDNTIGDAHITGNRKVTDHSVSQQQTICKPGSTEEHCTLVSWSDGSDGQAKSMMKNTSFSSSSSSWDAPSGIFDNIGA